MKIVTRWSPDTCGCVLEYEWDDTEPESTRKHDFKTIVNTCPEHTILGFAGLALFAQVMSENTRKSITIDAVRENLGLPANEAGFRQIIDELAWWFDSNRVLQISLLKTQLTGAQKSALQASLNTKFGANKVKVN